MSKSTISIVELTLRFSTQEKARVYIEEKRWGKDLVNIKFPCCSSTKITKCGGERKGYFVCYSCRKEFTVRTGTKTKTLALGLRERESGRVKAMVIQSANAETIQRILDGNVVIGSTISTDEATCFKSIENYDRTSVNHSAKEFVKDMASTNGVESIWALLKREV